MDLSGVKAALGEELGRETLKRNRRRDPDKGTILPKVKDLDEMAKNLNELCSCGHHHYYYHTDDGGCRRCFCMGFTLKPQPWQRDERA